MTTSAPAPRGKWIDAIDPDGSVVDAARHSLEARLMAVAHHLPLAAYHAEQDCEHVHRLRVSTRRAMAAVELYNDWLPRKRARWVKRRLRQVRRMAGEARDLDVLAHRLSGDVGAQAAPILAAIADRRAAIQPDIVRLAERLRRNDRFVRKTAKLLARVRSADTAAAESPVFRDWAAQRLATMAAEFFAAQPDSDADLDALHQFRIRAKALRYAMELLAPAFERELREKYYPMIEQLQERLGAINDRVTAREQLQAWASEAQDVASRDLLFELAQQQVVDLTHRLGALRDWWTADRAERLSRGLGPAA